MKTLTEQELNDLKLNYEKEDKYLTKMEKILFSLFFAVISILLLSNSLISNFSESNIHISFFLLFSFFFILVYLSFFFISISVNKLKKSFFYYNLEHYVKNKKSIVMPDFEYILDQETYNLNLKNSIQNNITTINQEQETIKQLYSFVGNKGELELKHRKENGGIVVRTLDNIQEKINHDGLFTILFLFISMLSVFFALPFVHYFIKNIITEYLSFLNLSATEIEIFSFYTVLFLFLIFILKPLYKASISPFTKELKEKANKHNLEFYFMPKKIKTSRDLFNLIKYREKLFNNFKNTQKDNLQIVK